MEVSLRGKELGRVQMELFGDVCPLAVDNFRLLFTGERGNGPSNRPLWYKGCKFFRAVAGKGVYLGDVVKNNGTDGHSVYGEGFPDESYAERHTEPGLISAVKLNDKNNSQILFTSGALPKLDGKQQVIGRVLSGMDIISRLESIGDPKGVPMMEAIVTDCGEDETAAMERRQRLIRENDIYRLPRGWVKKESRKTPGMFFYSNEELVKTQFHMPYLPFKIAGQKRPREDEAPEFIKCTESMVRVIHILKKHKDFSGRKPSSWRKKDISISKTEAREQLEKLRAKFVNIEAGGGFVSLKRKFENIARVESDCDSAKKGGELPPIGSEFPNRKFLYHARKTEPKGLSKVVESDEGVHLILRVE